MGKCRLTPRCEPEISKESFPFNQVAGDANILIFPDLQSVTSLTS